MRRNFFYIKALAVIIFFLLSSSSLAVMTGLSTEELTRNSYIVVLGEVEDVESRWSEDGSGIYSIASIFIDEVIKGVVIQEKIAVEYEGGEIGDIGQRVSDVSSFKQGETVILFLGPDRVKDSGVVHNIVGKAQGKYSVNSDGIARKSGFSVISGGDLIDNNIHINELVDKIREVK